MSRLSANDRALLTRCPIRDYVPRTTKGLPALERYALQLVADLRQRGLIAIKLNVDCSDAHGIVRDITLTEAGVKALHE